MLFGSEGTPPTLGGSDIAMVENFSGEFQRGEFQQATFLQVGVYYLAPGMSGAQGPVMVLTGSSVTSESGREVVPV
jgi:hypothetical protein